MTDDIARFGPGGNGEAFHAAGYKSTVDAPAWVRSIGLDAYEYEAGNGLTAGESTLRLIGEEARAAGIRMSFHTPYFISLSGVVPEKRLNSIPLLLDSLHAADCLGAGVIVVHTGSASKITRREAMTLAADTLYKTLEVAPEGAKIGLETMGKQNQLGTLDEVIELCEMSDRLVPVVDFGHMNARDCGGVFPDAGAYRRVFNVIGERLGDDVAKHLHCHFSRIEWTDKGERRHLTFADTTFGPDMEPLMDAIARDRLAPTIISESAGTQSEDALTMKQYYLERLKERI